MSVKLINIFNSLKNPAKSLYSKYNGEEFLIDTELLSNESNFYRRNVLYICNSSLLNKIDNESISKCSLLILKDEPYNIDNFINKNISILEYKSNISSKDLLKDIKEMFINDYILLDNSAILLDALVKEKKLEEIVEIGSELVQNPVIVVDSGFKVLANSDITKIAEPFWVRNIKMGYCSYEFISTVKKIKSFKESSNSNKPFIAICDQSPIRKLISKIVINKNIVGFIVILESNEKFIDNTYEVAELLSNIVSESFKKDSLYKNSRGLMYENLITDILENKILDEKVLKERLRTLKLKNNLQLMLIEISSYNTSNTSSNYLKKSLEEIFPENKSLFYEKYILILVDFNENTYMDYKENKKLIKILKDQEIIIAISPKFYDVLEINNFYNQCKDTLNFISKLNLDGNIFYYDELKFYHMLYKIFPNENLLTFCSDKLKNLIDYDSTNQTDYFNTLKVYLESDKNAIKASERLYIHRNTINYRLNKIKEISAINLNDTDESFRLAMSIKILDFVDKFKSS